MTQKEQYIGIMSGTSLDGVDVVLCQIDNARCTLLASLEYLLPQTLKSDILAMLADKCALREMGEIDHRLGVLFAEAVKRLLERENIESSSITAIGLHGQTLWHEPNGIYPFTMQLGDPNILTAQTGIPVVADFRRKDVALGGQGAPFAPAFHEFMFCNSVESVAVVNIGGMANITVLNATKQDTLIGYDTGCGNVLLDLWITQNKALAYDKEGAWARMGAVDFVLLDAMMQDAYFADAYPKSTGREKFNDSWLQVYLGDEVRHPEDIQRTLLEFTAVSISNEVLRFDCKSVLLCGGGAKNTFLVERLKVLLPKSEVSIAPNADEIEAMAFAWLAYKRIHKEKVNLKNVTGARENAILGAIYE